MRPGEPCQYCTRRHPVKSMYDYCARKARAEWAAHRDMGPKENEPE